MNNLIIKNKYKVISELGKGAFSKVYKIENLKNNKFYALKKVDISYLKEKEKENSLKEINILSKISNTYIIKFIESFVDETDNSLCIIMELASGGDLYEIIKNTKKEKKRINEKLILKYFFNIVEGLVELHSKNIFHRDLKSANIFLSCDLKKALIGDFNVSIEVKNHFAYTQTGTPFYAAPEVWRDEPYDCKADIWSLGCILYEMCMLSPPFISQTAHDLNTLIQKGVFGKWDNKYSDDMLFLIKKCLTVNNLRRPHAIDLLQYKDKIMNKFSNKFRLYTMNTKKITENNNSNLKKLKSININLKNKISASSSRIKQNFKKKLKLKNLINFDKKKEEPNFKINRTKIISSMNNNIRNYKIINSKEKINYNKILKTNINNKLKNPFILKKNPEITRKIQTAGVNLNIKNIIKHSLDQKLIFQKLKKLKNNKIPDFLLNPSKKILQTQDLKINRNCSKIGSSIRIFSNYLKNKKEENRKIIYNSENYKNRLNLKY